jgi:hypothetical protein
VVLELWKVEQKYWGSFEKWCWRKLERISWTDRVRNKELQTVKERNILQTIKKGKANRIGHILCRNCNIKTVTEGKTQGRIEVMGR